MNNLTDLEAMQVVLKEFRQISKLNRTVILNMLTDEHAQIGDAVDDPYFEIKKRYIAAGRRAAITGIIPFIKEVREVNKIGLKEAKDLVESW
jgi:ribosomal protein L7/L12